MKELYGKMGNDPDMEMKKKAKLSVLKELKDMASKMMGDDFKNGMESMKKVTVASPTAEGLETGLEKAQELTEDIEEPGMIIEGDGPTLDDKNEEEEMDMDSLEAKIQMLMEKKKKMMGA